MDLKERDQLMDNTSNFIKLWIEQHRGSTYEFLVSKNEQIFNLKLKLEIEEDIPVLHQTLFYGDDELNDSFTIEEYEIEHGATLRLVLDEKSKKRPSNADQAFAIDEQTYNLLFDKNKDANMKNKHYSLTDSKSIDEFRLLNAASNLGCISVNENALNDFDYKANDERTTNKKDKMDQLLIRMQKLSFNRKPTLPENDEIRFNKLKNIKRLSDEIEKKKFVSFRSNSSFDLIMDYDENGNSIANNQVKKVKDDDLNRPMSVPIGVEKKQIRFTSSVFKPIKIENTELENKRSSKANIRNSPTDNQTSENKKCNIPLGRIRLPKLAPVDMKIKKGDLAKVKKKAIGQISKDKDDSTKTSGLGNSLINKLNLVKGGSGSNKGEFIYEMICASWMNYSNEQMYECQQDCQKQKLIKEQTDLEMHDDAVNHSNSGSKKANGSTMNQLDPKEQHIPQIEVNRQSDGKHPTKQDDHPKYSVGEHHHSTHNRLWNSNTQLSNRSSFSNISIKYTDTLNFVYSYIDIERLILDNLKERIKSLGEHGLIGYTDLFASDDEKSFDKKIDRKKLSSTKVEVNKDEADVEIENEIFDQKENSTDNNENKIERQTFPTDQDSNKDDAIANKNHKDQRESSANQLNNQKEIQNHQKINQAVAKEFNRKQTKRKRTTKNSNWSAFLKACEEDFESNQSRINVNYNSKVLRECMFTYANCITNNWLFSLIEKEIDKRNSDLHKRFRKLIEEERYDSETDDKLDEKDEETESHLNGNFEFKSSFNRRSCREFDFVLPEVIYVINLIPNQINIFRHCLFLQQQPNLTNFNVNFIAINLISGDLRKKDLDSVISHSIQEELNFNYMNYFRSINRLTDVQIRQLKQKIRIRITKGKNAIKMNTESDVQFLFGALENNQEIDLSSFKTSHQTRRHSRTLNNEPEKGNLLFLLDDVVDIGDLLLSIEDHSLKMSTLRKFIDLYVKQKEKISFNRLYS